MKRSAVHLLVRGRVQGVGFRWFVRERARALRVSGWVRNRPDGSVEVEARGDADRVAAFVAELRTGPPRSEVLELEIRELPGDEDEGAGFDIRH